MNPGPKPPTQQPHGVWQYDGFLVVDLKDHAFPNRCIFSGATDEITFVKQKIACMRPADPWYVQAVLGGAKPWIDLADRTLNPPEIVALSIPVSRSHLGKVDFHNVIIASVLRILGPILVVAGILFLFGLTPLGDPKFFGWRRDGHQQMCWTLIILGTVTLGFGLAWLYMSQRQKEEPRPLAVGLHPNRYIQIGWSSSEFTAHLPDWNTSPEKAKAGW